MAITAKLITESSITVMMNGKTYILTEDNHQHYTELRNALKTNDIDTVERLIDLPKAINRFGAGKVVIVDNVVMYGDTPMHNALSTRMIRQIEEGFDVKPLIAFMENLMANPSMVAREELYLWLETNNNPITDDGHFIAFKRVRPDFTDHYTGTIDNSIGQKPEMNRDSVDDNRLNTCSAGLHFAAESYIPFFHGNEPGHTMVLKINPAEVVSIPVDYGYAKGRCWRYEVIGEVATGQFDEYYKSSVHTSDETDGDEQAKEHPYAIHTYYQSGEFLLVPNESELLDDVIEEALNIIDEREGVSSVDVIDCSSKEVLFTVAFHNGVPTEVARATDTPAPDPTAALNLVNIVEDLTTTIDLSTLDDVVADQPNAVKPQTSATVIVSSNLADVLFTKTQACAILGVTSASMDAMIAAGDRVERVARGGKNWIKIK